MKLLLLLSSEYTGVVLSPILTNVFSSPSFYVPVIACQLSPHVFQHTLRWSASCPERVHLIARTVASDRGSGVRRKSESNSKGRTITTILFIMHTKQIHNITEGDVVQDLPTVATSNEHHCRTLPFTPVIY